MQITVVGAGISGLATAFVLRKAHHSIKIIAKDFSPNITSNRAAAFWFPYHIRNDERGIGWCKHSYEIYKNFAENNETGVSIKRLIKVVRPNVKEEEDIWFSFMPEGSYHIMKKHEIPKGNAIGYDVLVPLIETQIFLPWLTNELQKMNIEIEKKEINSFDEIENAELIINCSGLASQHLCNDKELIPIRGQVALLEPNNFPFIFLDNEMPLYIVPRKDAVIVGGTFEEGINDAICEPATLDKILDNAYKAFPELKEKKIIGNWAGLRPYRPLVRVERERNIIHNYGHGGSGFTLAWGCAEEVARLVGEK
ncbi:MAG: FAD-binding oxidoreductase [Bacteroidota bacterium]|nr:FAD-binding oxidoreductase [Bacteroidota bacterium]